MKITERATDIILSVMSRQKLDPQQVHFEIKALPNGSVGIGFNREIDGIVRTFGALKTVVSPNIDTDGVVIDYRETDDGKKGLFFITEVQNVNQSN